MTFLERLLFLSPHFCTLSMHSLHDFFQPRATDAHFSRRRLHAYRGQKGDARETDERAMTTAKFLAE